MSGRPDRQSFAYRVYCSLVCEMKIHRSKKAAISLTASKFGWKSSRFGKAIYDRHVRPQLRAGRPIEELT
jgi:hypothetical protein